jgi:hypothetical protein
MDFLGKFVVASGGSDSAFNSREDAKARGSAVHGYAQAS